MASGRWRTRRTLPERIVGELRRGPCYGTELARRLGATSGAASGALTSLKRQGYVEVVGTEPGGTGQPRVLYALVDGAGSWSPEPLDPPAPRKHPEGDVLERLAADVATLREEYPLAEIETLMLGNRGCF